MQNFVEIEMAVGFVPSQPGYLANHVISNKFAQDSISENSCPTIVHCNFLRINLLPVPAKNRLAPVLSDHLIPQRELCSRETGICIRSYSTVSILVTASIAAHMGRKRWNIGFTAINMNRKTG